MFGSEAEAAEAGCVEQWLLARGSTEAYAEDCARQLLSANQEKTEKERRKRRAHYNGRESWGGGGKGKCHRGWRCAWCCRGAGAADGAVERNGFSA